MLAVALLLIAAASDAGLLAHRIRHVGVSLPTGGSGQTWVVIGIDSRASLPSGVPVSQFGSAAAVPGARADVVLLVHRVHGRTTSVTVPRDLLVDPTPGEYDRLTATYFNGGPQGVVNGLCRSLGVAATHVVVIDMSGFASVVDDLGGITVTVAAPVRDAYSGLQIERAGRQRIGGVQALALVRSRHPQDLVGGRWVPEPDGAQIRSDSTALVFTAIRAALHGDRWNPLRLQRVAWTASHAVRTDHGTGLRDLASLARSGVPPATVLPAKATSSDIVVLPDAATSEALAAAGFSRICTPRG